MAALTTPGRARVVDLDVTRAVALIGVCVMNYHGYLLIRGAPQGDDTIDRFFDPWTGPLSTRFATTFVMVAGMGVSLLTARSRASGDDTLRSADRWMLVRRGVLLYVFGYFFNWVWEGTILFYYGALFLAAAALFTLRIRWLVAIGVGAALAAAAIQWWAVDATGEFRDPSWLTRGPGRGHTSLRELAFDTFVRGTHPLLPWLAFFCLGIVIGRLLPLTAQQRLWFGATGVAVVVATYLAGRVLGWHPTLQSTHPFDRSVIYSLNTMGSAVAAFCLIGWLAERSAGSTPTTMLAAAGRTTLTLYVLHAVVFNLFVDWLDVVPATGLAVALAFAAAFWAAAIVAADLWQRHIGIGPLESVYRRFSGSPAPASVRGSR